ncbi:hypothetical protein AAGQ96_01525 [Pantoea sp. MBD-2R]|uniref:hypothetical protein n=1 Tax=unclassified Pantoea TaxID=2630326 RepID=UPI0011BFC27A|nr:hypothetical protein [Pantoea sp. CCBC3-3-1]
MSRIQALLITAALGASVGIANAATVTDSLLQCNPAFFHTLYQHRAVLKKVVQVESDGKRIAWVPVTDKEARVRTFTHSVPDGKLHLSGYYEQSEDLGELGKYYYWGFVIDEAPEKVMAAFPHIQWLKGDALWTANPQIKLDIHRAWQPNPSATDGIAPAKGSVEKLVMLNEKEGKSWLSCSIQGSVERPLLLQERPDIAAGNN